jgi:N-acetyl-1-D-myo-inositol-2-amino-2-deoxy-alpha-D-glucopyranoside deacetylase
VADDDGERRLLLVHAHPDDETINNGATMARYAAAGARVALVTCTRGELGEVIPPDLAHLAVDREDRLGEHRVGELAAAMAALGVTDHYFLDELGLDEAPRVHYRDSGMVWGPDGRAAPVPDPRPGAFALVEVDVAAARLASFVRTLRPHALVTYEPGGGYGHPDHVQTHRVAMRAIELAASAGPGGSAWDVPKVYWTVVPEGLMRAALKAFEAAGESPFDGLSPDGPLPSMAIPDDEVTTAVDGAPFLPAKAEAMRAHASQIAVDGPFFALSNGIGQPLAGTEFYRLAKGTPAGDRDPDGRETDLFAGL